MSDFVFGPQQTQMFRMVLHTVADRPDSLEVGETIIIFVADEPTDREVEEFIREGKDHIDKILAEEGLADCYAPVAQSPPTSKVTTENTDEVTLRRSEGDIGLGIERTDSPQHSLQYRHRVQKTYISLSRRLM